ncbi:MAG: excinuclease ABC subunit UvrC [Planctomycetes bacterium]|nr:excinuclease ABC subunit UvrC [Planctomycetota bacterium]
MKREELLAKAKSLPHDPGVYIMKDEKGTEIYVGKAKSLRKRVSSYFLSKDRLPKEAAMIENVVDFDYIVTDSEVEALLLESRLIKDFQPRYNMMLKNNEQYPMIEVTMGEDFPRIISTRRKDNPKSKYFGPFISGTDVKICLAVLQRIFKFRTCSRKIDAADKRRKYQRGCLNFHIGRCAGACCDKISKEEYRKRINSACRFLSGQKKDLIADLRKEMDEASANLQFESAAAIRDMVDAIETVNAQPEMDESLMPAVPVFDPEKGLEALQEALGLPKRPSRIEGIDIANLQGKETVGSLVYFVDGVPFKDGYRRFKIKTVEGQDDFSSISEVVGRRYGRLVKEGKELPDIILIDGGKGQLGAAAQALAAVGAKPMALMSLAKKEETPYVYGLPEPLNLSRRNPGLKLLMYVRDESHRFAQHYHHILRRKAMFGEK